MRLRSLKRHWERLGRRDPLWAVLTDPHKQGGRWDVDEFFHSGVEEIGAVLRRAAERGITVPRTRALDFGCGVGRLTQAMAAEFERCDGVDISTSMLDAAERQNRRPDRCTYHLNAAPDLARFADGSFTFVYSSLVLQHMAPAYSTGYIRELVRVLAPNGLLVFQLPSGRSSQPGATARAATSTARRLPEEACKARLRIEPDALVMRAGVITEVAVVVENLSRHAWPAGDDGFGRLRINLANHWLYDNGESLQRDDGRCPLPHDVAAGSRIEMRLSVTPPLFDGVYRLEVDLVQENVTWFSQRGSEVGRASCRVEGGRPGPHPRAVLWTAPPEAAAQPPFRERHPRAFRAMQATGVRDAYWTWRRAKDHVKRRRDRLIVGLREVAYEPVIPPIINWWNRRPFAARMEMYCVPKGDVVAIVRESGGQVIDTEEDVMPGQFESCRYWVRK